MLQPGQAAPLFDLPDADMNMVSLQGYRNKRHVVLYFYPKDDTPGCTMEAIEFSELDDNFGALKTVVLGVSMDDCLSHGAFRDKHGLSVQLLADVDGEVWVAEDGVVVDGHAAVGGQLCRRYGVLQEKELEGKLRTCIIRSTFIIDRKGHVMHALYGVSPRGHAEKVLGLLQEGAKCK